jgi:hypothetical protein
MKSLKLMMMTLMMCLMCQVSFGQENIKPYDSDSLVFSESLSRVDDSLQNQMILRWDSVISDIEFCESKGYSAQVEKISLDFVSEISIMITQRGLNLRKEAANLKFGDPNYEKMLLRADYLYLAAIKSWEIYLMIYPNDKGVLNLISTLHKTLKNIDKSLEYKKRADNIK